MEHRCLLFLGFEGSQLPQPNFPKAGIPTDVPVPRTVILIFLLIKTSYQKFYRSSYLIDQQIC